MVFAHFIAIQPEEVKLIYYWLGRNVASALQTQLKHENGTAGLWHLTALLQYPSVNSTYSGDCTLNDLK